MNIKEFSVGLADAVERAAPAVVRVEGRRLPSSGIVGLGDGTVVTAAHTLHRDEGLVVGFADGSSRPASVVGVDPATDVAVLRVEGALPSPAWREGDPRVGEIVLTLGRPNGGIRATLGIVSFVGGARQTSGGARIDRWLEVDGTLPPGFSGGPLVDAEGALIGLNTSALGRGGGTIPVSTLRRVVDGLLAHGTVRRGWLGIGVQGAALGEKQAASAGRHQGLLVTALAAGGPAERDGVQAGDILLDLNGAALSDAGELLGLLDTAADRAIALRLLRGDAIVEVAVTPGARPAREGREGRRGCR